MEKNKVKAIIDDLSLEEKAYLVTGKDFWRSMPIERHNIPSTLMIDGPHGLRKQVDKTDHLGINKAQNAICFPTASAMACSFDLNLLEEVGILLGEEAQAENVGILLGPANNIKRSPLCGRNFEYFSEDPYLAGKLSAAEIRGIQSQGIGTSLKHYVANNQERLRNIISAKIDERTLREIYLTAFEIPVKESKPWTVMNSYNKINGVYLSENHYLLNQVLKQEWGFDGMVISDWGASDELTLSVAAGMDLEMPSSGDVGPKKVIKAVKNNQLSEEALNEAVARVLGTFIKVRDQKRPVTEYNKTLHHQKAREAARECMVLLKNKDQILPLDRNNQQMVGVIGEFAKKPRFQGGGSSHINAFQVDCIWDELQKLDTKNRFEYAKGYSLESDEVVESLIAEAVELAKRSDVVILAVGLIELYETEGLDRGHLEMPPNHQALIDAITEVNQEVVVVLSNGSPIKMPFEPKVKGILEMWLTGEAGAGAAVDILYGDHNPSGKLAETFIKEEKDDPSFGNFPGNDFEVVYEEGLYVGYRYHDRYKTDVLYEFGYGLSYTTFEYSNLTLSTKEAKDTDNIRVTVDVTNTGLVAGKESLQLYIREQTPVVDRPIKELKGFAKVSLEPGETKQVAFELDQRSFAYYHVDEKAWCVHTGNFDIMIGKSSIDVPLTDTLYIMSTNEVKPPRQEPVYVQAVAVAASSRITRNTYVAAIKDHPIGKRIYRNALGRVEQLFGSTSSHEADKPDEGGSSDFNRVAIEAMVMYSPFRNMVNMSAGERSTDFKLKWMIRLLNWTRSETLLGKVLDKVVK